MVWEALISDQSWKYVVMSVKLWTCNKIILLSFIQQHQTGYHSYFCAHVRLCFCVCVWVLHVHSDLWISIINHFLVLDFFFSRWWKCHVLVYCLTPLTGHISVLAEQCCHAEMKPCARRRDNVHWLISSLTLYSFPSPSLCVSLLLLSVLTTNLLHELYYTSDQFVLLMAEPLQANRFLFLHLPASIMLLFPILILI